MRLLLFIYIPALLLSLTSCKKEESEFPSTPEISFISISSTNVDNFQNRVVLTFSYLDKEGDIGEADPDNHSLRIKDARLVEFDWYHIPPVTPDLQSLQVTGILSVELNPLFLLGNGLQESTHFTIQVRDRAGNWSNQIDSPEVIITDTP